MTAQRPRRRLATAVLLSCAACSPGSEAPVPGCQIVERSVALRPELSESSGLTASRRDPTILWTHNDSGDDPVVYAVGRGGELLGAVLVQGAENRDWEDIASGPCPEGSCLYIADTGDNEGRHPSVDVYRVAEPDPASASTARPAERFRIRYPGGARDTEAIFVLPSGGVFLISKGRREPVELFRYPLPLRARETVEVEPVVTLTSAAQDEVLQVTGADASPDGEWVAVRAYRALMIHRTEALLAGDSEPAVVVDLTPLGEAQGEAVTLADDGTVILSSESTGGAPATLARLVCTLPR